MQYSNPSSLVKQIVHLELLEIEFKKRKAMHDRTQQTTPGKTGPVAATTQATQDELDLIGGTTEDDFTEAMQIIRERELLYGPKSLLTRFGALVTEICSNSVVYKNRRLQSTALLCLGKLMCVSSEYCDKNLNLFLTILENSTNPTVRSNAVIALGDMAVCFNHLIDENTDYLYKRLNDPDPSVKRTCLMTLTFLILAGQVKVKGQLGEMAKCLEDKDRKIADLAKMFFTELATKDNAVYNQFVDIFSVLTASSSGPNAGDNSARLEEDAMRRIVKFLAGFIEKDKHARQLAEKLATRLARCETERQWNDVSYTLGLLQHKNEDIQKLVQGGFKLVQAKEIEGFPFPTPVAGISTGPTGIEDGVASADAGVNTAGLPPTIPEKRASTKGRKGSSAAKSEKGVSGVKGGRGGRGGRKKVVDDSGEEVSDAPSLVAARPTRQTRGSRAKKAPVVEDPDDDISDVPPARTGTRGRRRVVEEDSEDSDRPVPLPEPKKPGLGRGRRKAGRSDKEE